MDSDLLDSLARSGIREYTPRGGVIPNGESKSVRTKMVFICTHMVKSGILSKTRYKDMKIDSILLRIPGAHKHKLRLFNGINSVSNGVSIPLEEINSLLGDEIF
ncbi:hypothetical protein [Symmachiella dynata]|uniref:hypothetical protein n=1 Tax=Symmachiella dynata TaxID=2527995 RepID=UPI0030EF053D